AGAQAEGQAGSNPDETSEGQAGSNPDHSEELAQDLAEACKKKKKSRESPKTPPGSPSHKREVFRMAIPGSLITADIREASYYQEYLANVTKNRRFLAGETGNAQDSPTTQKDRINILQAYKESSCLEDPVDSVGHGQPAPQSL
nr:hypothetical protein [Tanacetum cinerariifolium]